MTGRAWDLGRMVLTPPRRPLVMGIVNLTSDSFHAASRRPGLDEAVAAALAQREAGADVIDLGAESTRPGADPVNPADEQERLLPVLEALRSQTDAPITVDTRHAVTAARALTHGADAINDITAGADPDMLPVVAERGAGLILMHMQGTPRTMQQGPHYDDPVAEVSAWLAARATAAEALGIPATRVMVDPGIGFGKTLDHNLALLGGLDRVAGGRPLLLGASRKRFIGDLTGAPVTDRLPGSLAAAALAHQAAVTMVRVHDVAETIQFLDVLAAMAPRPVKPLNSNYS